MADPSLVASSATEEKLNELLRRLERDVTSITVRKRVLLDVNFESVLGGRELLDDARSVHVLVS